MSIQKFQVKLYAENGAAVDLEKVIPVFHTFIRDKKVGELLIDVADYGHVADGPGVVIIGHASDYYLDMREGRPGLNYSRKRDFVGDTEAALLAAVRSALTMASLIEREPSLGIRFAVDEVVVRVNDRLGAKNDDASFASLRASLESVFTNALGKGVTLTREGDARDLLTVRVKSGAKGTVSDVLARVA